MSSRALRRAQRELEERKQLELFEQENAHNDAESEEDEGPAPIAKPTVNPSLFSMLGDVGKEDDDGDDGIEIEDKPSDPPANEEVQAAHTPKPSKRAIKKGSSKKGKKKKTKGKGKSEAPSSEKIHESTDELPGLDEIDQALLALNLTSNARSDIDDHPTSAASEEMQRLFSILAVDTQHLHAANEMRKLFGRAAVQGNGDDEPRARNRRQQDGIAAAAAGRNNPGGRNLASLALRRNIFIQGKEEWPQATLGGLGMEVVKKHSDGTVEYRFVHNTAYQGVQRQFESCVASMDPQRMIQHLHFNPYHISTLLQVSEIAKQQRDNATSSELLERALFAFGRAIHSTFAYSLSQGKARLDFRRPENREFWLAVWRYIATLGIRATWRTAFEWTKLLLGLSPTKDPYCMRLIIDQLSLRGREPQALVDFVECDHLERAWKIPPNLAYSVALAHDRLKQPVKARKALLSAIKEYPWIASRICTELEISPIPQSVWGQVPEGNLNKLLCQLYVPYAKDLWNTTEGTTLLVEVCNSINRALTPCHTPYWLADIEEIDLARHVILSEDRSLLILLNPHLKSRYTSVSDPLPPDDNMPSYSSTGAPLQNPDINRATAQAQAGTDIGEFRRNTEVVQDVGVQFVSEGAVREWEEDSDTDG
ncbi:hypothetical protein N0V90_008249 [Kalmusia sp. IMI 367209]|nr:hypothetical protein N0V90_008249 [Kalmusia sp. IMI 367209]